MQNLFVPTEKIVQNLFVPEKIVLKNQFVPTKKHLLVPEKIVLNQFVPEEMVLNLFVPDAAFTATMNRRVFDVDLRRSKRARVRKRSFWTNVRSKAVHFFRGFL